mmetsp:Transcript_122690/g.319068  ORF Transcript_122690/g.319068 Transcript_122690/m.319068 type:complete len:90 (+) Transcript_122690:251-520(+)
MCAQRQRMYGPLHHYVGLAALASWYYHLQRSAACAAKPGSALSGSSRQQQRQLPGGLQPPPMRTMPAWPPGVEAGCCSWTLLLLAVFEL